MPLYRNSILLELLINKSEQLEILTARLLYAFDYFDTEFPRTVIYATPSLVCTSTTR